MPPARMLHGFARTALLLLIVSGPANAGPRPVEDPLARAVADAVAPVMAKDGIPGVAVAVTQSGRIRVFDFGAASRESGAPVTERTLFEVGSVTKTLTATLASWAQVSGRLSLSDSVARWLPSLAGTSFGGVQLRHLATHTPGGLPLQVPDTVSDEARLMEYFARWTPEYPPGTRRTYSNPGIGALGVIAARSFDGAFIPLVQERLLPALGMHDSFLEVPEDRQADYAQGYAADGTPARLAPGVLWAQAYGLRTTAADMARFVAANMGDAPALDPELQRAIVGTHTGYFADGPMTQDLVWEQYAYPVGLRALLRGNGPAMIFDPTPVAELRPPAQPRADVWINKTGSTRGFSAYVAFVPVRHAGVVLMANRNIPIEDRVRIVYAILRTLTEPVR